MNSEARHVIISGGGTGVGAMLAERFAANGDRVTILGRRPEPLQETAQRTGALPISCDVTDRPAVEAALARAAEEHGPARIVIANAGHAPSAPFDEVSREEFDRTFAVNVGGTFNLWQAALPALRRSGRGRLIAIASTAGLKGYPYVAPYCAAKHAVIGLVRALARELAETFITVNAICPGFIETPLLEASVKRIVATTGRSEEAVRAALRSNNPQNRFIPTEEVAAAAIYVASDEAQSVNGHALTLAGGEI